ncbi:DUF3293 domain-containing protein [Belnapia sp. T18]|uniref:DUF3293 domain-containing protein n=1 Tax=Belnapia arida TaxID=2804533 RepID=A0ABS1U629_9PROT|nr:DUF3293 domain-containing protein [Belnapia arida]MBL6080146.1 DUF3293 domain-containing protein [Belnapia arida]
MTAGLIAAYRRTTYEADGAHARIGRRSAAVDSLLRRLDAREGGFVTAWNPLSRKMPTGWNDRMLARLREVAHRLPQAEGAGGAGGWEERHLLLGGDARRIAVLGRRFRQVAIVAVRRGQPARLVMLRAQR